MAILNPLEELGISPVDVTDIVLSHHHRDHTVNMALFGEIAVHGFQAIYCRGTWEARAADDVRSPHPCGCSPPPVTPPQDLSALVGTPRQVVVLTCLW